MRILGAPEKPENGKEERPISLDETSCWPVPVFYRGEMVTEKLLRLGLLTEDQVQDKPKEE